MPDNPLNPEILPDAVVRDFLKPYAEQAGLYRNLADRFGSPLFIVDPAVLRSRAARFTAAFDRYLPEIRVYYAMKSNNLPYISQTLAGCGLGLDVSGGPELCAALDTEAGDIIFSGPGKTVAELGLAAAHPDRVTLLLDSFGELDRLAPLVGPDKGVLKLGIRININPKGLWRKFGILPENAAELYAKILHCPGVRFTGFQFHSSWNMAPSRQVEGIRAMGAMLATLPAPLLAQCEFIDIGGGYWPEQGEWLVTEEPLVHTWNRAVPIETFARELSGAVREWIFPVKPCRICLEPGRWLCNDAAHILIRVVDKKESDLVITDAGTNAVGWERFETDYFPVLNLTRPAMIERPCQILGALCTPHDVWGMACFGEDVREGDLLFLPTQGAYTYSLRQQFIKALPRVVVLEQEPRIIDNDDFLSMEDPFSKEEDLAGQGR